MARVHLINSARMIPEEPKTLTYKQAGVDIEAGDLMVERIKHLCSRTHSLRRACAYGAFAGLFRLDFNEKLFRAITASRC